MKRIFLALAALLILSAGAYSIYTSVMNQDAGLPRDYREVTFSISGESVSLAGGALTYFGNEVTHDLDGDGTDDVLFLVTQEIENGTNFYAVGALKREAGYIGTQAVLLGTNIAPQTTEKGKGRIAVVNYTEQFVGAPSVGRSVHLLLDTKTLEFGEVVQGFEGESR